MPDEGEFRFRNEPVPFRAERIARHLEFFPREQRCKHQLRNVFRQRRDGGKDERRWSTEKHRHRQRLIETLGFVIVKAATFLNLPV